VYFKDVFQCDTSVLLFVVSLLLFAPHPLIPMYTIRGDTRGMLERFVDSPYYFEIKLCGGALTVSFSKYLPWQVMCLQSSAQFSKTCCRPFATSFRRIVEQAVFLPWSSLFMVAKAQKLHGTRYELHRLDG
jgi:hypothetical protein